MKILLLITSFVALACSVRAQVANKPEWTMTVKVIDEQNQAVTNAAVKISWHVAPPRGQSIAFTNVSGLTDGTGTFATHQRSRSIEVMCRAEKEGYYSAGTGHEFAKFHDGDPAKWNPTVTLLLKKIINPIAMYVRSVNYSMPTNNVPVGYDLMVGDWVRPYGKGDSPDILFTAQYKKRSEGDYDYNFIVNFPKHGDGIQGFGFSSPKEQTSDLRSPHEAPLNGYEPQLVKSTSQRPRQYANYIWNAGTNYFFRVRSVPDGQGGVKSAYYGKIYGDFDHFEYYLNPTPNDRNVEFDSKQNLLKGLKSFEQVRQP